MTFKAPLEVVLTVILVEKMKEIVMLMMSVKMALLVDQTIVQLHLVFILKLIVVIPMIIHVMIHVCILDLKVTIFVMMKTIIVDVNGMEETVVVVMLTQITVMIVTV